jgi:hypothetical protein
VCVHIGQHISASGFSERIISAAILTTSSHGCGLC